MDKGSNVGFQFRLVSRLIRRYVEWANEQNHIDRVTAMHGWVIGYLYEHRDQDIFQRDIEKNFSIRRSTVTAMLQLMEKNDLITREPVRYDARLKKISLTPKAIRNHEIVSKNIRAAESKLTEGISEEEINAFLATMEKIKNNLSVEFEEKS